MRAVLAAVAVVIALLLGVIAYELHQVNQHLAWVSAPIKGLAAIAAVPDKAETPEQREKRIAERARVAREASEEGAEVWRRVLTSPRGGASTKSKPSPPSATPADHPR